jgi:thymidylate kinase
MGLNPEASNVMLPTTWLMIRAKRLLGRSTYQGGPRDPNEERPRSRSPLKNFLRDVKSSLLMANLSAEEWFRQIVAWIYKRHYVVVFDRDFYSDFYNYDIEADPKRQQKWYRQAHGWMLEHLYPRPDLVIFLDAPAAVLYARKHEGSVELLEQRRESYLHMREHYAHFEVVDANRSEDQVFEDVVNRLVTYSQTRESEPVKFRQGD